jgi:hypothetical protein
MRERVSATGTNTAQIEQQASVLQSHIAAGAAYTVCVDEKHITLHYTSRVDRTCILYVAVAACITNCVHCAIYICYTCMYM